MVDTRTRVMIGVGVVSFLAGGAIAVQGHRATQSAAAEPVPVPMPVPAATRAITIEPPLEPFVHITDPRLLAPLDTPFAFASVLSAVDPTHSDRTLQPIARTLADDIARIVDELAIDWELDITRTYDVSAAKTEIGRSKDHRGNGNVARVLDARWLTSSRARFPLAAVVYRPDRRDFVPGTCGELRLVYRLAYTAEIDGRSYASRLPVTLNLVWHVPDDGVQCRQVASRFHAEPLTDDNAEALAQQLLAGPLALDSLRFAQLELDAQIVRMPSDLEHVEGRGFAGQALYWMRIFAFDGAELAPIPLENTPDVQALRADPAKRTALRTWIAAELAAIDRGVFHMPDALAADIALSWSTQGSARLVNRPFAALVDRTDADAIVAATPDAARTFVVDGRSLLERLDQSSCTGCHQSSSTAGFHMLGFDRDGGAPGTDGNRLQLPFSPHFAAELPRRLHDLALLERGEATLLPRPHPSAPAAQWQGEAASYRPAGVNRPCVVAEAGALAAASSWSCEPGLECRVLSDDPAAGFQLGQCVPPVAAMSAGMSCRSTTSEHTFDERNDRIAWNVRGFVDRIVRDEPLYALADRPLTTAAYNCRPARIGVPLGRITRNCTLDEKALLPLAHADTPELCAVVGGKGFEQMATGLFDAAAFAAGVGRGMLDTCSATRACREDYICQQLPDFLAAPRGTVAPELLEDLRARGLGFCTPTYFVYQLRLDGHPAPE